MVTYGELDLQVIKNTRRWIELTCAGCNQPWPVTLAAQKLAGITGGGSGTLFIVPVS